MIEPLIVLLLGSTVAAAASSPTTDFWSSQLFGVIVGVVLTAALSFLLNLYLNRQQNQRDRRVYDRQVEREGEARRQSLMDARRERLRNSYRVLLKAADAYEAEVHQMNHVADPENIPFTGADEAVNEITLEGVGTDVLSIFFDVRKAFYNYTVKLNTTGEVKWEDFMNHMDELIEKIEELKIAMNRNLKELEQ